MNIATDSPFSLDNDFAYQHWRSEKLAQHPTDIEDLIVPITDPFDISTEEANQLAERIKRCNMAIYSIGQLPDNPADKDMINSIGNRFGLTHLDNNLYADEDAISSLTVTASKAGKGYIPYTNRPIAWHTDGYYNSGNRQIRAMLLHCVRPAQQGGQNELLDHEIAYILLRDLNPEYIAALSLKNAMSIPANIADGKEIRPAVSGPVFSLDPEGNLHMRYTARTRSIEWLDDPQVQAAKTALEDILKTPSAYHLHGKLQAGQGLLCNNVLHTRSKFEADSDRLLFRARYFDRITLS